MADSAHMAGEAPPPQVSSTTRILSGVMSVTLFGIVGAWLGSKLGKLGDRKGGSHGQRLLTWLGGIGGGLLAVAAQPDSAVHQAESRQELANQAAGVELAAAPTVVASGLAPLPKVDAATATPTGTLQTTPEHVRA